MDSEWETAEELSVALRPDDTSEVILIEGDVLLSEKNYMVLMVLRFPAAGTLVTINLVKFGATFHSETSETVPVTKSRRHFQCWTPVLSPCSKLVVRDSSCGRLPG